MLRTDLLKPLDHSLIVGFELSGIKRKVSSSEPSCKARKRVEKDSTMTHMRTRSAEVCDWLPPRVSQNSDSFHGFDIDDLLW